MPPPRGSKMIEFLRTNSLAGEPFLSWFDQRAAPILANHNGVVNAVSVGSGDGKIDRGLSVRLVAHMPQGLIRMTQIEPDQSRFRHLLINAKNPPPGVYFFPRKNTWEEFEAQHGGYDLIFWSNVAAYLEPLSASTKVARALSENGLFLSTQRPLHAYEMVLDTFQQALRTTWTKEALLSHTDQLPSAEELSAIERMQRVLTSMQREPIDNPGIEFGKGIADVMQRQGLFATHLQIPIETDLAPCLVDEHPFVREFATLPAANRLTAAARQEFTCLIWKNTSPASDGSGSRIFVQHIRIVLAARTNERLRQFCRLEL